MTTHVVRRLLIVVSGLLAGAATTLALAGPAAADVPEGWPDNDPVEPLHVIGLLVGIPLLLVVVITIAVYLPAMMRGERVAPGSTTQPEWLGGPRSTSAGELAAPDPETSEAGGAGGRW